MVAKIIFVAALSAFAMPAIAQDKAQNVPVTTEQLCRELTAYQPSEDVDYKPGTDVYGNDVAPADVDGTLQVDIPKDVYLAITVDQATQLGLPANIPYKAEAFIGGVVVRPNGDVYFNNKRISQAQIQTLCDPDTKSSDGKNQ